ALRVHVDWQIANGVSLLIPAGTTGETSTLTESEWLRVVEITVEAAEGRVPVFAGATHNSTAQAVENVRKLARIPHLAGILIANPYYNRPGQEGQFQHFKAVAEAVPLPILLYNIPGRTGANLEPDTVLRLADIPNIVGIKESSGLMTQITSILTQAPRSFRVFAGDDALTLPTLAVGGVGVISVASNAIPQQMSHLVDSAMTDNWIAARRINRHYFRLMQALFTEPSPAPIKAVLALLGRGNENLRLPMVPVTTPTRRKLERILGELGLLFDQPETEDNPKLRMF
ncbi:MAG TPA: 4-hydroxy-tetrahydrodipicolinate synthase, partial [Acidobacteriaceae bacterium]|nr:4-hydroxy-tetrahydrodipicolinate synthase [Acidobacteriaceae bacterium]